MERVERTLKEFGLTENEIKVYLESLKHENLSPYDIAKLTGIPRTTIYDIALSLALKGLVELDQSDGLMKQQTKIKAKNPSVIREILAKKRRKLTEIEFDLIDSLPQLKRDYHKKAYADFQFYPGIDGAREVYNRDDQDNVDLPFVRWTKLMPMDVLGMDPINQDVDKVVNARIKQENPIKELVPLNDWTKHVLTYQCGRNPHYLEAYEIRYIDDPIFETYVTLGVKGNQVRAVCEDKEEIWGLIINSLALSNTLRSMFNFMWRLATPVTLETVKRWGKNEMIKIEEERVRKIKVAPKT